MFKLIDSQEFSSVVKFLLESVTEILKQESRVYGVKQYLNSDFSVLADSCATLGIINESTHASFMHMYQIYISMYPSLTIAPSMQVTQLIKTNCWSHSYKSTSGFAQHSKKDAIECLKIVYDFLKVNQASHTDLRYEPFLTLIEKDLTLIE